MNNMSKFISGHKMQLQKKKDQNTIAEKKRDQNAIPKKNPRMSDGSELSSHGRSS